MTLDVRHRTSGSHHLQQQHQHTSHEDLSSSLIGSGVTGSTTNHSATAVVPQRKQPGASSYNRGGSMTTGVILGLGLVVMMSALVGTVFVLQSLGIGNEWWSSSLRLRLRRAGAPFSASLSSGTLQKFVDRSLYDHIQEENKLLQKQIIEIKKSKVTQDHVANTEEQKQMAAHGKYVELLTKSKTLLHQQIQTLSKRALLYKYGPGPYYVELWLSFDPASNVAAVADNNNNKSEEDTASLIILLAPEDEMPATVYHFMEQINATLYDGASFHRNAGHVVQGGPTPNFESKARADGRNLNLLQPFRTAGLEHVPFQEYSPNVPHKKYTLGYAGRPGGPDFYISTSDNTRNHGPGGQNNYDDPSEADPCFASVMHGYEPVVDRIHQSAVEPGGYKRMRHYVAIRTVRWLSREEAERKINVLQRTSLT